MSRGRLRVAGGRVLSGDPGAGRVLDADVLVEDGRVRAVEPRDTARGPSRPGGDAEVLDARGGLVLPGFVDTHRHVWQTALRGITADWTLTDYFWRIRTILAAAYEPDDVLAGNLAGGLEALEAGVTCLVDFSHCLSSPAHADAALDGLEATGIRGVWAYGFYPVPLEHPPFAGVDARVADLRRIRAERLPGDAGRLRLGVALSELGVVPWEATAAEIRAAEDLGLPLTTHTGCVWHPRRPREVELLHAAGLLGPEQLHVHCNACTDRELDLLAEAGAAISSTPETELQMGMGFPVLERARRRGIRLGLGCDIASNNRGDLFTQMRLGLQAERARANQPALEAGVMPERLTLTAAEMLRSATLGGAEALGLADVCGSIDPGKAADLVVLRTDTLALSPVHDGVATAVLQAGAGDVEAVLVGGEAVKRDGRLVADASRARALVEASAERIVSRVADRGGIRAPLPDGFADLVVAGMEANLAAAPVP